MLRRTLTVVVTLLALTTPSHAASRQYVLNQCLRFFGHVEVPDNVPNWEQKERKTEASARAYFSTWSTSRLRSTLTPLLRKYKTSDTKYAAVAFVMAYYGVDVDRNVGCMLRYVQNAGGTQHHFDGIETVGVRLQTVYHRHPSRVVLRGILEVTADAWGDPGYDEMRIEEFLRDPKAVLTVASTDPIARQKLVDAFSDVTAYSDADAARIKDDLRKEHRRKYASTVSVLLHAISSQEL